ELTASIDGHVKIITEASLRRHLKLEDNDGVTSLPNSEIFKQLALIGRRARIVLSEDEEALEDSSKQGRKISDIDEDPNISLVQDEGVTWFQDADTELVEDQGSGEKGEKEVTTPANYQTSIRRRRGVNTGSGGVSTASRQVSTTDISIVGEIGSTAGVKAKDKGKGIMTDPEPKKKTKLKERQKRVRLEAAIRLQEQQDKEERQRLARDAEIAQRQHEEINVVVAQETSVQAKQSEEREQVID
ncbi:hypothetical protein Tco_1287680, partial [Tanacetum coccineum]